ncbi:MAG: cell division protein ZapA [Leptospiraceae bacterium]|nr:cell division protein ZapA [Leptospiraceae bacterium]MCK6380990.1 cell division protein ZapA [Leptospiraceae bacterium]NUM40257.1 cell division protein ZapA [Leptospiraceae bacterium]
MKVEAKIYGSEYLISGSDSKEYILELTDYVDQKMRELAAMSPGISVQKLAVLSAVNIADELFQEKNNKTHSIDRKVEEKTKKLISLLEEGIVGDSF